MSNSIAKNFKFFSLLRFALPTMVMMIFMSLYSIVDGIFISRLLGTNALSAANIVYPVISIVFAVGIMLSTGGSALIAKKLGEGKEREAREDFSFLTLVSFLLVLPSCLLVTFYRAHCSSFRFNRCSTSLLCRLFKRFPASCTCCHAPDDVSDLFCHCRKATYRADAYHKRWCGKYDFGLSLYGTFQYGNFRSCSCYGNWRLIPAVIGLFYFLFTRHSLYLTKPVVRFQVLKESCFNGSSEMVTNLSTAVVTYLFNITMLKFLGEPGVAAITIVLYGQFLFNALYMGFSMGVAPVISYNHGSQNLPLLKRIFKICIGFISISSILITIMALVSSPVIVEIFTPIGSATYDIAKTGFFLFSINYIFAGINIYSSSMFTAFSDGKVSALISFVRTFVLIVLNILLLPYLIGVNGVWLAVPAAEFMTLFLSVYLFYKKRDVYHYL